MKFIEFSRDESRHIAVNPEWIAYVVEDTLANQTVFVMGERMDAVRVSERYYEVLEKLNLMSEDL